MHFRHTESVSLDKIYSIVIQTLYFSEILALLE